MAQKETLIWIAIAIVAVLVIGMFVQKNYELFSAYTTSRTCSNWIEQEKLSGNIIPATATQAPLCWYYSPQQQYRLINVMTPTSTGGCSFDYTIVAQSACPTSPPPEGSCLLTDTNGNGKVDRTELGEAAARWISGT